MIRRIPRMVPAAAAVAAVLSMQPAWAQQGPAGASYTHGHAQPSLPDAAVPAAPVAPPADATAPPQAMGDAIPGRAQWLAECRRRLEARDDWRRDWESEREFRRRTSRGADECETYIDDYYAHARAAYPQPMAGYGAHAMHMAPDHSIAGHGKAGDCCHAMPMTAAPSGPYILMPVMLPARRAANCEREVIEYVEEAAPVRRVIPRRAAPRDKRIRIAPDKRVRTQ